MPIDPIIRARMLELPRMYEAYSKAILEHTTELGDAQTRLSRRESELTATLVPGWKLEKSNEQVRTSQIETLLASDIVYQDALESVRAGDFGRKANKSALDVLRFEANILIAICNNESPEQAKGEWE